MERFSGLGARAGFVLVIRERTVAPFVERDLTTPDGYAVEPFELLVCLVVS